MKNLEVIKTGITRSAYKVGFALKKNSPTIFIIAGTVGVVASAVTACVATTKLDDILDESKEKIDKMHTAHEHPEMIKEGEVYTDADYKRDLTITYIKTGVKVAKLYAPSVIMGAASIMCIYKSHDILTKRNAALAAAYAAVDKSFKDYRGRVVERFGDGLDRELLYNIKAEEIETTETDAKGKEKTVKKTVEVADPSASYGPYAKFYDCGCTAWEDDAEYNLSFLQIQEQTANDMLISRGYLFLNEVYDMLGIPRTKAGQIMGWIWDPKRTDNKYVNFGIYNGAHKKNIDFVNGIEPTILLDFNAWANVYETVWKD